MRTKLSNSTIGDLVWVPAGSRLWQLIDGDKKIPKYKVQRLEEPKYLLVTGFSATGGCLVNYNGDNWQIEQGEI